MMAAIPSPKVSFTYIKHITCMSHLYHNCAMKIRNAFPDVDFMISSMKALAVKYKQKQKLFEDLKQILKLL